MATTRAMIDVVANAISSLSKKPPGMTKAQAYEQICVRADEAQAKGEEVTRFWFEDTKYAGAPKSKAPFNPFDQYAATLRSGGVNI
jgi:hypothetical protein